ncbi:LINE-1 type transposase domain containing protein 1 [Dissostichus eleginoides]|uniref:LINE-1 type transposase domain containing protein 1 n=1 Tax=Dissostichus eleginoides TaxID=100907 RepID=A0AAD9ERP1_DISEL|nr:LINE-1 type transposase domain containing protein 1 [Dissostichus eleginoides]
MKQGLDSFREETNRNFETAEAEMRAQKKDIEILEERTAGVEEWSTDVQDIITASLEQQTKLQDKLSDIEGRSRRNNVRIWGLKEGIEGDSVSEYVNRLIHKELGMSEDIKLEIQRAHRALALNPQPDKFPRAIIVNFLRFEVKENVIKTAWRTVMEVEGRRVTFDHDYSSEVAAKRRKYAGLKRILKDKGIRFQSPMDTLRVYWNEGTMLYKSAQDAARAMRQRGWQVPDSREERPTLLQRLEAARKWTRVRRPERGDNNETRVREDRHRIGGADE